MAVFELNPCDMISAPKNTFKYTVFSIDFGVYLSISLKFSSCLSNLKKSSIFSSDWFEFSPIAQSF